MEGKTPTFIVGAGRSGTTFLHGILDAHPKVALTNEAHLPLFLTYCVELGRSRDREPPRMITEDGPIEVVCPVNPVYLESFREIFVAQAREMITTFYARWFGARLDDITHWGDKMPSTPPQELAFLKEAFPWAFYVVPIRDPRDYVASYRASVARASGFPPRETEELARHWLEQNAAWVDLPRAHCLRYEDLMTRPRDVARAIFEFLGLAMLPPCGAVIDQRERLRAASATTTSVEASLARWRRDLSPEDVDTIESICAPLMERFDYARA